MKPSLIKVRQKQLTTSIKTIPQVIINQLGYGIATVVHQHYNPLMGWEIAVEEHGKTHIIICIEHQSLVKVYSC